MTEVDAIIRIIVAAILGGFIGFEREFVHKPAGLRTHIFVSMGAALFTVIALLGFEKYSDYPIDPTRIIAAIITGIGFLAAGVIIERARHIEGITTAAGLWVSTGIGMAVGAGHYLISITVVVLSLVVLLGVEHIKPDSMINE